MRKEQRLFRKIRHRIWEGFSESSGQFFGKKGLFNFPKSLPFSVGMSVVFVVCMFPNGHFCRETTLEIFVDQIELYSPKYR
jgi:hypothetical protein